MESEGQAYCVVTETTPEAMEGPLLLPLDTAWIGVQLYLPDDIQRIQEHAPDALKGGPQLGPDDCLVTLVHNHIEREDLVPLLQGLIDSIQEGVIAE